MSCWPRYGARCVLAGLILLLGARPVRAWESDVHYGMTHWLAQAAGFDSRTAHAIAAYDEGVDLGSGQGAYALDARACLMRDSLAGRFIRDHHYPSIGGVPGYPETRAVVAGGDAARATTARESGGDWAAVGRRLHVLQDSWSHRGVPEVPRLFGQAVCSSLHASGHSAHRGGPRQHHADVTHRWPGDVLAMAQATYDGLRALALQQTTTDEADVRAWIDLIPELRRFTAARTREEKAAWFRGQGYTDLQFLEGISLPGMLPPPEVPGVSGDEFSRQYYVMQPPVDELPSPPEAVVAVFDRFLDAWLVKRNFASAISSHVDITQAAKRMAIDPSGRGIVNARLGGALAMWLLKDHGRVAMSGHAVPLTARGFRDMYAVRGALTYAQYTSLHDAMHWVPGMSGRPYGVIRVSGSVSGWAAVLRLRHARYDTVLVLVEQRPAGWKITAIDWLVH